MVRSILDGGGQEALIEMARGTQQQQQQVRSDRDEDKD
jgi:hypothetical protein